MGRRAKGLPPKTRVYQVMVGVPENLIEWMDRQTKREGQNRSRFVRQALLFYKARGGSELLENDRIFLCDELIEIAKKKEDLGRQITQDEFNELKAAFDKLGGTMKNMDEILPKLYTMEIDNPVPVSVGKKAVFEKVYRLLRREDWIQKKLATLPEKIDEDEPLISKG